MLSCRSKLLQNKYRERRKDDPWYQIFTNSPIEWSGTVDRFMLEYGLYYCTMVVQRFCVNYKLNPKLTIFKLYRANYDISVEGDLEWETIACRIYDLHDGSGYGIQINSNLYLDGGF